MRRSTVILWTGTLLCALIVASAVANAFWVLAWFSPKLDRGVVLQAGALVLYSGTTNGPRRYFEYDATPGWTLVGTDIANSYYARSWVPALRVQDEGIPLREIEEGRKPTDIYIWIPLWIPFVLIAIPSILLWRQAHRERFRAIAKWTATIVSLMTILAFAACVLWESIWADGATWGLSLTYGCVYARWDDQPILFPPEIHVNEGGRPWQYLVEQWAGHALVPRASGFVDYYETAFVVIPLWIPLLLTGIPALWMWRHDRRLARPGSCPKCGYNLTGNESGVCPECGTTCRA